MTAGKCVMRSRDFPCCREKPVLDKHQKRSFFRSTVQMKPVDRFNLDFSRISFLTDDKYSEEIFFIEEERKVGKTNVFSINSQKYECPVDLREKKIQVRFDRNRRDRFIVYFNDKRMGKASLLDLHHNARQHRQYKED